jgi:ABC-type transport system substrate-binding protein
MAMRRRWPPENSPGVRAIDDKTLELKLSYPDASMLHISAAAAPCVELSAGRRSR